MKVYQRVSLSFSPTSFYVVGRILGRRLYVASCKCDKLLIDSKRRRLFVMFIELRTSTRYIRMISCKFGAELVSVDYIPIV